MILHKHDTSFERGTTLIAVATDGGIVMAADDLAYAEKCGEAVPRRQDLQKVFVAAENILIGSAGAMSNPQIKYEFKDWITAFIETHRSTDASKLPSDIALDLHQEIRKTFEPIESSPESGGWQDHKAGQWLASYIVAGYAKSFQQSYFFEVGAQVNLNRDRLIYPAPAHKRTKEILFGEDNFAQRALRQVEPQYSEWLTLVTDIEATVADSLPDIPISLQEAATSAISFIKVEAKFNPKKVGQGVFVCLINRLSRSTCMATF